MDRIFLFVSLSMTIIVCVILINMINVSKNTNKMLSDIDIYMRNINNDTNRVSKMIKDDLFNR